MHDMNIFFHLVKDVDYFYYLVGVCGMMWPSIQMMNRKPRGPATASPAVPMAAVRGQL